MISSRGTAGADRKTWLRAYFRIDGALNWLLSAVRGAFDGIWLGVLNEKHLSELDRAYYDSETMYVDEAYNRGGQHDWEKRIVDEYFPAGGRVAVTGAGGGREVLALLDQGFDVFGYEPNAQLAAFGSSLTVADGVGERVLHSRRDGWPGGDREFDAVIAGWGAYMLIPGRLARVRFLRDADRATGGAGPIMVSYFTMPSYRVRFRAAAAVARRLTKLRDAEPPLLGDALAPNYVHFFTRGQVAEEFSAAGLEVVGQGNSGADVNGYGWTVGRGTRPRSRKEGV